MLRGLHGVLHGDVNGGNTMHAFTPRSLHGGLLGH